MVVMDDEAFSKCLGDVAGRNMAGIEIHSNPEEGSVLVQILSLL